MNDTVLVIGLGNTLCGDDALGQIASERVRLAVDSEQVKVISQCAPTPELAAEIAESSLVVFLDASADGPADRIRFHRLRQANALEPMAHRLDAVGLLGLSQHLYGRTPEAFALTFRGQSFEFRDRQLSPAAEAACDLLAQEALQLIRTHATNSTDHAPS